MQGTLQKNNSPLACLTVTSTNLVPRERALTNLPSIVFSRTSASGSASASRVVWEKEQRFSEAAITKRKNMTIAALFEVITLPPVIPGSQMRRGESAGPHLRESSIIVRDLPFLIDQLIFASRCRFGAQR